MDTSLIDWGRVRHSAFVNTLITSLPFPILGSTRNVGANQATRALTATDFGANAAFKALEGTIGFQGKVATVSIRSMEGNLGNAWQALNALKNTARAGGASSLRIEATLANPGALRAMERMLGPATRGTAGGFQDIWVIGL